MSGVGEEAMEQLVGGSRVPVGGKRRVHHKAPSPPPSALHVEVGVVNAAAGEVCWVERGGRVDERQDCKGGGASRARPSLLLSQAYVHLCPPWPLFSLPTPHTHVQGRVSVVAWLAC